MEKKHGEKEKLRIKKEELSKRTGFTQRHGAHGGQKFSP
jgi:hypothetical protein